jgi:hypothetical protein
MLGPKPPLRKRIARAVAVLVVGALMWIIIPDYIGLLIATEMPASALTDPVFVLVIGTVLTGLQVADAMAEGTRPSIPIQSAVSLLIAYYIWAATNGGNLVFAVGTMRVALDFQVLVLLVILPSLWTAVRTPLSYFALGRAPAAAQAAPAVLSRAPGGA